MTVFPDDFLEDDGRFRALLPGDFVPILYVTRDGSWHCADCLNTWRGIVDPLTTNNDNWRVTGYELHYDGPDVLCDACSAVIAPLYGDPDEPASS